MALITRTTKAGGGTSYSPGKPLSAAELEEAQTLVTLVNGNLDNANVANAAGIFASKNAGHSNPTATNDPGTTAVPLAPSNLEAELGFLRYAVRRHIGTNTRFLDSGGIVTPAGYQEPPIIGSNLLRNSSFEIVDAAAANLPQGWAIVGTPTLAQQATTATEGDGFELNVAASAAVVEGISQTINGIRDGSLYLVGCRVKVNAGTFKLETTGAVGPAVAYQNIAGAIFVSGTYQDVSFIVKAAVGVNPITLRLVTAGAAADDFDVDHAFMYELGALPATQSTRLYAEATVVGTNVTVSADALIAGMAVSITPPAHNYMVRVRVEVPWVPATALATEMAIELLENAVPVRFVPDASSGATAFNYAKTVTFEYTKPYPVAGTLLAFTVRAHHSANNYNIHPIATVGLHSTLLTSYLTVELIPI